MESRDDFERRPDHGLVGKGCTRPLNVFWNWIICWLCGTVILLVWCESRGGGGGRFMWLFLACGELYSRCVCLRAGVAGAPRGGVRLIPVLVPRYPLATAAFIFGVIANLVVCVFVFFTGFLWVPLISLCSYLWNVLLFDWRLQWSWNGCGAAAGRLPVHTPRRVSTPVLSRSLARAHALSCV